ncbi:hypothetical protein UFOVP1015_4 [uncultured Caudovirales phage]|uniref:Uncharacterized protein n=1 Tax=uncultured Caudovirales phage TaxID=2100421 RepID=A0A6J7XMY6_9CAUD|nr:hypothetical protein UFOVP1015_4 [uncultured Caudovirales phage]CAB5229330.1 hypothetical protein UFOVP1551_35 [uncultured Caudovirales phage]
MKYTPLKEEIRLRAIPFEKWWVVFKRDKTCNAPVPIQLEIRRLAHDITGLNYDSCCHGTFIDALQTIFLPYDKFKTNEIPIPVTTVSA